MLYHILVNFYMSINLPYKKNNSNYLLANFRLKNTLRGYRDRHGKQSNFDYVLTHVITPCMFLASSIWLAILGASSLSNESILYRGILYNCSPSAFCNAAMLLEIGNSM